MTEDLEADRAPYRVESSRAPVAAGPGQGAARYVLLVSIDGLSYPTLQRMLPRLPNLRALAGAGFSRPMETIFPSMTWSAHASAVTGQYPDVHGILGNRWYQGGRGLVRPYAAQTSDRERMRRTASVYDLASRRGLTTAALNWPGTQFSTTLDYNLPETMYDGGLPRRLLSRSLYPFVRRWHRRALRWGHATTESWRDALGAVLRAEDPRTDRFVTDVALQLLRKERSAIPRLMMVHYVSADLVQHGRGTRSPRLFITLRYIDRLVGELLRAYRRRGLASQTTTLVFSDHGFADVHRTMDLGRLFKREGLSRYRSLRKSIARRERVLAVLNGHAAFIYLRDQNARLQRLVTRLLRRPEHRSCIEAVYTPREYHKLGLPVPVTIDGESLADGEPRGGEGALASAPKRHPGAPQLIALTRPGCAFRAHRAPTIVHKAAARFGSHGYLPTHRAIQAFLIGAGAGIARSDTPHSRCRIVDIAPTAARLLDLRWPRTRDEDGETAPTPLAGRPLDELLQGRPKRAARPGPAQHAAR